MTTTRLRVVSCRFLSRQKRDTIPPPLPFLPFLSHSVTHFSSGASTFHKRQDGRTTTVERIFMHRSRDTFLFFFFLHKRDAVCNIARLTSSRLLLLSPRIISRQVISSKVVIIYGVFFLWIFIYLESYEKKKDIE